MDRFRGKATVVTGGASGIGLATAQRLAMEGAAVAIIDLQRAAVDDAVAMVRASGGHAVGYDADVSVWARVEDAFVAAAKEFGHLDAVVNCAGIIARGSLEETSDEEWHRVIEVDLTSIFYSTRAALPLLRAAGSGAIVNIASLSGTVSIVNVAYEAAKGGVVSLTRRLADELAKDGIRVNSVSPGLTATPLNQKLRDAGAERRWVDRIPLGRYGHPREIAAACAFLASEDASYVTGFDLIVDGGVSAVLRPLPA